MNLRRSGCFREALTILCFFVASAGDSARGDVFHMNSGLHSLELVPVGNPGNPGDTQFMNDWTTGYGAVAYPYLMGKYEITAAQYTQFLNSVAKTDTYGLYDPYMMVFANGCRIVRAGRSSAYSYSVALDFANRPVNYINYWDAARFANWLHNGQPSGLQDAVTTEDGAYTLNGYTGSDGTSIARNPGARFFIPSESEWYKAAYYDPVAGHYWDYPTGTDAVPDQAITNPDTGNNANYDYALGAGSPFYYRNVVGEFENSESPYGTYDQLGNVWEWNEAILVDEPTLDRRGLRGGAFESGLFFAVISSRTLYMDSPDENQYNVGFRIAAAVPEPSTVVLSAIALVGVARRSKRRRMTANRVNLSPMD